MQSPPILTYEEIAKTYWQSTLARLDYQTEELSQIINGDMQHKIRAWNLKQDEEEAYKSSVERYFVEFEQESRENDRAFVKKTVGNHVFMLNLWRRAGMSPWQIQQENYQHTLDSLRELRAHRRSKEIRFDHFMDKKLVTDTEVRDVQLAASSRE